MKVKSFTIICIFLFRSAESQVMRPPVLVNNNIYLRPNSFMNRPTGALNPGQDINRKNWISSLPYHFPYNRFNERITPYNSALIQQINNEMINRLIAIRYRPYMSDLQADIRDKIILNETDMSNPDKCLKNQNVSEKAEGTQRPFKVYPNLQSIATTETQDSFPINQTIRYEKVYPPTNSHNEIFHNEEATPVDVQESPTNENNSEDIDIRGGFN
ncbi:unnamed protein product [Danaus chrysippus]|uniref:(African queen) hypothetical protein n=1 Tax=Danaus chrysippus TaxID=151541 RepID=A0A8J2QHX5_9NEOP|nr:unnamed protein product [Danaus chrysippus]